MKPAVYTSFDGTTTVKGWQRKPSRYHQLLSPVEANKPLIARGAGMSYVLASAGEDCQVIEMRHFNRICQFNPEERLIQVEPCISLGALSAFLIDKGFYLPVMPGHPAITIGGCVAMNVHGKSSHHYGSFRNQVDSFSLYHPAHGEIICSRQENSEIFDLTTGGFGLTGIITSVTLRLAPVKGYAVKEKAIRVDNLAHALTALWHNRNADLLYGWLNFMKPGDRIGEGLIFAGDVFPGEKPKHPYTGIKDKVPNRYAPFPAPLFNRWTTRWFNALVSRVYYTSGEKEKPLLRSLFAVEGKEWYYKLFGKRGLWEYSMLMPLESANTWMKDLAVITHQHGVAIPLVAIRLIADQPRMLNFTGTGVIVSIDVIPGEKSLRYMQDLDQLVRAHQGRVNLAKDSRIDAETVRAIFPEYEAFKAALHQWDPARIFKSALSQRIDV